MGGGGRTRIGLAAIAFAAVAGWAEASIIGDDDRVELSLLNDRLQYLEPLSKDELAQIRNCTGMFTCIRDRVQNSGSASLVGSNATMVTARHILPRGGQPTPGLCSFTSFAGQRSDVVITQTDLTERDYARERRNDVVVLPLKRPFTGCTPFPVVEAIDAPRTADALYTVTRAQLDQIGRFPALAAIGQECRVFGTVGAKDDLPTLYFTDCDLDQGGSGGINLVRAGPRLTLHAVAVFVAGGHSLYDHRDIDTRRRVNQSISIGLDGFVRARLPASAGCDRSGPTAATTGCTATVDHPVP